MRRVIGVFLLAAAAALMLAASPVFGQSKVVVYLFWGDGCPHCAAEKPFLEELATRYPLDLRLYEVWHDPANLQKLKDMAAAMKFDAGGVPVTIIGSNYWVGYNEEVGQLLEQAIQACVKTGCSDAGAGVLFPAEETSAIPTPIGPQPAAPGRETITLPILGKVDLSQQSLLISTLLIAFVDGVNPCSLWVLTMLLSLTLHTGSRRKVVAIGLIFLTVTAGVYGLFIAGIFTLLSYASYLSWIQGLVALVSLFFGLVNIKDYFWYKEGLSFTIADDKKPGIFRGIRRVMDASQNFWAMAGATVVLSAGVSLVEFSCTAGFPVMWSNMLTAQHASTGVFFGLLLVYMIIYQLDELGIFFFSVYTLKATKLEEKHGRILKLIGGMLMLSLALVMLVNPALMNNLTSSLLIFGGAFAATGLLLLLHRKILPHFGIWIGSEAGSRTAHKKRHPKG